MVIDADKKGIVRRWRAFLRAWHEKVLIGLLSRWRKKCKIFMDEAESMNRTKYNGSGRINTQSYGGQEQGRAVACSVFPLGGEPAPAPGSPGCQPLASPLAQIL